MRNFREVKVWQKAHALTLDLYLATKTFPKEELYGIVSQMRRSAASIGANIAEGCGKRSKPDLKRFLLIALGSASELEYHLLLARDLHFIAEQDYALLQPRLEEIKKMLTGFIQTLEEGEAAAATN